MQPSDSPPAGDLARSSPAGDLARSSPAGDLARELDESLAELTGVREEMLAVTGTAWSADRTVKVVVGPRGQLVDVDIDPRIYRKPDPKALAALIVATTRVAVARAMAATQEIIDRQLPQAKDMLRAAPIPGVPTQRLLGSHDADLRTIMGNDGDDD